MHLLSASGIWLAEYWLENVLAGWPAVLPRDMTATSPAHSGTMGHQRENMA